MKSVFGKVALVPDMQTAFEVAKGYNLCTITPDFQMV